MNTPFIVLLALALWVIWTLLMFSWTEDLEQSSGERWKVSLFCGAICTVVTLIIVGTVISLLVLLVSP